MNKLQIIKRKDHETYFLDITDIGKKSRSQRRKLFSDRLMSIHPRFNEHMVFDVQICALHLKKWALITVMDESVLDEYRFLYPNTSFVTATTLAIHGKGFILNGLKKYNDEIIGYLAEKDEPVSIPETEEYGSSKIASLEKLTLIKNHKSIVFRNTRKIKAFLIFFSSIILILMALLIFQAIRSQEIRNKTITVVAPQITKSIVPSVFDILKDVSNSIVVSGAIIDKFNYDESAVNPVEISVSRSEPVTVSSNIDQIEYLKCNAVSGVEFVENKPRYTVDISVTLAKNTFCATQKLENKFDYLEIQKKLRAMNTGTNISVLLETITSSDDKANIITMNIDEQDFLKMLMNMKSSFEPDIRLTKLSIIINKENHIVNIKYSFARNVSKMVSDLKETNVSKYSIIERAFGYQPSRISKKKQDLPVKPDVIPPGYDKIGTIALGDNKFLVYYKNSEGKILTYDK